MSILANYIYILGYLLKHLPSKANFLILLFLFLRVLLLYFLPLLGLFKALRCLPPIVLTMLWLRFLLPRLAFMSLIGSYIIEFGIPVYPNLYPSFLVAFPYLGLRA